MYAIIQTDNKNRKLKIPYRNVFVLGASWSPEWIYYNLEKYFHSGMGMVMTLEFSNMDKMYIFGTLMASEIT